MADPRRVAVIGSGFGGLAAAIRLQNAGMQVTVFEARDKPGGRAYVYEDGGFTFDAGPTVITAPDCIEELFRLSGRDMRDYVELLPVRPFYRLRWEDGETLDYDENFGERISAQWPDQRAGYERFLAYSRDVFAKGYTELAATPFLRFWDMVRVAPELARLRADRSVYDTVARFVGHEKLRQALSFHALLVGGNPFETSAIYTLIHYLERQWGVHFPRGGTGALVQALVRLLRELGGELHVGLPVRSVRLSGGKHVVGTDTGETIFDAVVSNADLAHTYSDLLRGERRAAPMRKRLGSMEWSMSLFVIYFGTNRRWPDLAHHTVLFGPRYEELLRDIFRGNALPDDFSLYLHAPTVTDPSLAPPGCEAFYVLSPVPHLGNALLDWNTVAPIYADRILAYLERSLPGLTASIVTKRWFTPKDFASELSAHNGSAFSVAPRLTQSAWFRPHNRDPNIPGLYLVGAGTHPGAGVPGVINSAKATAQLLVRDLA